MTTLVDWQIQHLCGDRSYKPQWWNIKAWMHKLIISSPKHPMIAPYNLDQVNAASYDVLIGDTVKVAVHTGIAELDSDSEYVYDPDTGFFLGKTSCLMLSPTKPMAFKEIDLSDGSIFWLYQGKFILSAPNDIFNIPRNLSAQFALKSSRAREGYGHALAGFIDPAWHNSKLTLELFNHSPNPIPIYKGLKIGQIIFTRCDAQPIRAYDERGRYNNDKSVMESKG